MFNFQLWGIYIYSQSIQQAVPIFHHQTANSSLSQVLRQFSAVNSNTANTITTTVPLTLAASSTSQSYAPAADTNVAAVKHADTTDSTPNTNEPS